MQPATAPAAPGAKTVSLVIALILIIVGTVAGLAVGYYAAPRSTGASSLCSSGQTFTLGALLDLSKDLSSQGNRAKRSTAMAIDDVNAFLSTGGCTSKFAISVSDYQLDNSIGATDLANFASSGIQVVVGPLNSGTAQYILSYANSHNIVMISPSSTSPALAIANDDLFRTVPNDAAQGLADARMIRDRGANALIIVYRDDTYGGGLANATESRFTALGGTVVSKIKYDTKATDYTPTVTALFNAYTAADTGANTGKVAMDFVSFEEFGSIIIQANQQHSSLLSSPLPWFGTDGEANDAVLSSNATTGPLLAQVRLPSSLYAPTNSSKTVDFLTRYSQKYSPDICDGYCLSAYDDVW
ncbi:MAG TPA: ABC transporter substrate-binding protein, partial [Candidatus Bathyarchaeia archaeon]|nr:ABC transporter substrate-binding protein [Candidatus Bathyarchaeia archaeon]